MNAELRRLSGDVRPGDVLHVESVDSGIVRVAIVHRKEQEPPPLGVSVADGVETGEQIG